MVTPTPYSKKGERWVNHTVQPGSYVVNDPRPPPPPPPPYSKPTGQKWARQSAARSPSGAAPPPGSMPPSTHASTGAPSPSQAAPPPPPPVPIPQAFQTPKGKTPRFYDPDEFRKFTETHIAPSNFQPTYSKPISDAQGRTHLPVMGDTSKRGPYSERLTRAEETELLKTCIKLKETYGAPSTQNKWWQTAVADFNIYRRKHGRNDLQAPTAKRRVEQSVAKRKRETEDQKESEEPAEFLAALDEWIEHCDKLEKGDISALSSKQAADAKLDEELERIKKEKKEVEREHPLPTPPPSSSTPTSAGPRPTNGQNANAPVVVSDSPPRPPPPQKHHPPPPQIHHPPPPQVHHPPPPQIHHPPPMHYPPPVYAPPAPPQTHHHHMPFPPQVEMRPPKRQRTDDSSNASNQQMNAALEKSTAALDLMTKLASSMFESQQKERDERDKKQEDDTTPAATTNNDNDVDMNNSPDSLFSPGPNSGDNSGDASRCTELERMLSEQREAHDLLQKKFDDLSSTITKFTEEAMAAETREKDRDKKIEKILQVLKKHFQGSGTQGQA